jgi:formamidopyrimidine-DNA glycosylase
MPELPDIELYLHALRPRIVGQTIEGVRVASPFVVRTFDPPIEAIIGRSVTGITRLGKRFVFALSGEDELFLVIHLMIAGRFRWSGASGAKLPGKVALQAIDFGEGTLILIESSQQKRASVHVVRGRKALAAHDPEGLDVFTATFEQFKERLTRENHTLKRSLTSPRLFDGIGNAFSDEILHAARLSPIALSQKLDDGEIDRLHAAARRVLAYWIEKLKQDFGDKFPGPGDVTAFRPEFAVHGKFDQPCPDCGTKVQRIRYADNETNYCPRCQTKGVILADRSLSRLLKKDWPRTVEELE